ncbi:MAG: phosphatase PAP2 family protein [Erysipelotrichaceae bacterium]|nr:phosphatase PAP2 family protein [Erysipelotrichaceae bacterium]
MFVTITSSIGFLPVPFFLIFGGTLMHFSDNRKNKTFTYIREAIAIVSIVFGAYYVIHENDSGIVVSIIEIIIVLALGLFLGYKCKSKNKELLTRTSLFILFSVYFTVVVVFFSKFIFCRPRFIWIVKSGLDNYRNFWQIDKNLKEVSIAAGVDSHMFRSLPSGHACASTAIILTCCFPLLFKNMKDKSLLLYLISIAFIIVICSGRIVGGYHFLSDVSIGSFVTFVGVTFAEKVLMRIYE